MLNLTKSHKLSNVNEINDLIRILRKKINKNISLPQDYFDFLINYNGANFEDICIKYKYFEEETGGLELSELVSVKDLLEWISSLETIEFKGDYYDSLINDFILTRIGYEKWGGAEISIGIGEKNNGFIYFSKLYSGINFVKLANTFTEFLENLEDTEE